MKWRTRLTELFNIQYPVIEGAFGGFGDASLAAAVSEAGGLGMITANTLRTPDKLQREIKRLRATTEKPFAVNISPVMSPAMTPLLDAAIAERVPVIETAGFRSSEYGKKIKEAGLIWIHKVTTVKHGITAEQDGADAVCIVGLEGAGLKNPDTLTTLVNIPMAVRKIRVPVIVAGGIGDARGFLAALAMGADAVMLGTVLMAVKECPISDRRKQVLVKADPYDPKWREPIIHTPSLESLQHAIETAKVNQDTLSALREVGRLEGVDSLEPGRDFPYPASLAIGLIDKIVTAKELIDNMMGEAEYILTSGGLGGWKLASS